MPDRRLDAGPVRRAGHQPSRDDDHQGPQKQDEEEDRHFELTGSDARAIASFECKLDARAFAPCTSPHTVKVKEGKHTFQVQAIDQAGNVGPPATDTWKRKKEEE